ncbi:putative F-box protein [Cardamine amara subsp. amara]|uniref:F-box protein n=1 Tax=Cardamine amara subsp. amara TaxID=228776 RepID=A0ABD1AJY2_CARAN
MRTTISNLPRYLIEEIFSRVPLKFMKAMRLTCKSWYSFTKMHIGKAATATKEGKSMMITLMNNNLYLTSVVVDDVDPYIEHKGKLSCLKEQVKISQVFYCEGLLLCILINDTRVVIWNPYLGQTRWIKPRYYLHPHRYRFGKALGYENKESCRNIKLLRFIDDLPHRKRIFCYEIYNFDSSLWTTLDVTRHWCIWYSSSICLSLKGNTYWCARKKIRI